jgi:uncharacterized protein
LPHLWCELRLTFSSERLGLRIRQFGQDKSGVLYIGVLFLPDTGGILPIARRNGEFSAVRDPNDMIASMYAIAELQCLHLSNAAMKRGFTLRFAISVLILGVCLSTVTGTLSAKGDDASSNTDPHPSASLTDSNSPLGVVKQTYAAFGRGDIPAILNLIADQVDWQEVCPPSLPYSGLRRTRAEVGKFFSDIAQVEEVKAFEPREFIVAGENVTVLGYTEGYARDTKQEYRSQWAHVFTVQNGKITRWRGFFDTAARYGQ